MNQSFTCHTDGESVWVEISIQQALDLKILQLISPDSHLNGDCIFLCEDTDLSIFLTALLGLPDDTESYSEAHWNRVDSFWQNQVNRTDDLYHPDRVEIDGYPYFSFIKAINYSKTRSKNRLIV